MLRFAADHGGAWAVIAAVLLGALRSRPGRTLGTVVSGYMLYLYFRYLLRMSHKEARKRALKHWDDDPPGIGRSAAAERATEEDKAAADEHSADQRGQHDHPDEQQDH